MKKSLLSLAIFITLNVYAQKSDHYYLFEITPWGKGFVIIPEDKTDLIDSVFAVGRKIDPPIYKSLQEALNKIASFNLELIQHVSPHFIFRKKE